MGLPGCNAMLLPPTNGMSGLYCPEPWVGLSEQQALHTVRQAAQDRQSTEERTDLLLLFRGHASWGQTQLDGELRNGSWSTCHAEAADVFEVPSDMLWDHLR